MKEKIRSQLIKIATTVIVFSVIKVGIVLGSNQEQSIAIEETNKLVAEGFEFDGKAYQLPENPTLEDYERFALQNNPAIKAVYARWQAAIDKIRVVKGLPDPKISFGYFLENIETAVGPQQFKIGLSQMIPWFGKLKLQGDIQALKADAEFQQVQSVINDILYRLKVTFYDYYYLNRSIDITRQNIDLVKNWEWVVLNRYKTATAGHMDLIKTQIESIKLQDDLQTLEAKQRPLVETFQALLNLEILSTIHIPDTMKYSPLAFSQSEVENLILQYNPGLKRQNILEEIGDFSIRRAKLNYLPDFGLGVDYIGTGAKRNTLGKPVPESGKDPLVIMGSLSFPLWWNKQGAQVKAAKYLKRQAEEQVTDKENWLKSELEGVWFELDDARRKLSLYQERLIPKSLESLRASEKAYISDKSDFLTLIDAQRRYLQFLLEYERSLVRYQKAYAKFEKLVGRKL